MSFLREKFRPRGGPDGGNGGEGGNVYCEASSSVQTLDLQSFHFAAEAGRSGAGKARHGKAGRDTVIQVPLGTVVREVERFVEDSDEPDQSPANMSEKERSALASTRRKRTRKRRSFVDETGMDLYSRRSSDGSIEIDLSSTSDSFEVEVEDELEEEEEKVMPKSRSGFSLVRELGDLVEDGQRVLLSCGGRGGRVRNFLLKEVHRALCCSGLLLFSVCCFVGFFFGIFFRFVLVAVVVAIAGFFILFY